MSTLFFFFGISLFNLCGCSTHQLSGQIQNPYRDPIQDVSVVIANSQLSSLSNVNGEYMIETPLQAKFQIEFIKPGYAPYQLELSCQRRRCTVPTVEMKPIELTVPYDPELLKPVLDSLPRD